MKVLIGVDPHKASVALAALDEAGELVECADFPQNRVGLRALERWATRFPERRWAIENAGGLGRHLAQRLAAAGEAVARRARVVEAHAELRERELAKLASWSEALEGALVGRGLPRRDAELLAEVSVAVFHVAYRRWLEERPERELAAFVHEALFGLGELFVHAAREPRDSLPAGATSHGGR